ncbi:MAG: thioredoxin-disulfide reductase [Lachnospiraceae bacterium]|nr:thioredoxin-disulfide reductase [Lachnospiraceae bacterium]
MYDLIIIGSGPAGLSAAIYAKRGGLDVLVLESNYMSGGQVLNTYEVDNYLGMPGMNGFDMGMAFRAHVDKLGVPVRTAQVTKLEDTGDSKLVHTRKEVLEAKAVIVATGAKHAQLEVPGEKEFSGKGVSYCATCDGAFYKDRTVAVVGGGDVALEDAIYLSRICKKVYLIHRRDELRGAHILQEELKEQENVEILYSHTVQEIQGTESVESVRLLNKATGEKSVLAVDGVFIAVGIRPNTELVQDLLSCDEGGYIPAGEDGMTSLPGIWVAGDIRKKPMRQIITAVADGANAAMSVAGYLRKKK